MISISDAVERGVNPRRLAQAVLSEYYGDREIAYPINPFQMLTDFHVRFCFRAFSMNTEGVYFPVQNEDDIPVVGININRLITRQRYTAAHELCHHIKDAKIDFVCASASGSRIERYADNFAAELLMPYNELRRQITYHEQKGSMSFDAVLHIADYFGVSFHACLIQVISVLKNKGYFSSFIKQATENYPVNKKRNAFGFTYTVLYEQLIDAIEPWVKFTPSDFVKAKFCNEYIFNDSRLEGVDLEKSKTAEVVTDLRIHGIRSPYRTEGHINELEVAGHALMYEYMFELSTESLIDVFTIVKLHKKLYSCNLAPEFGGSFRKSTPLVMGAKFETIPHNDIATEMLALNDIVKKLCDSSNTDTLSDYIKTATKIHHRLTVIHPFGNGNGRSSRAFLNLLLIRRGIFPIYIKVKEKNEYYDDLAAADKGKLDNLYMVIFKAILNSQSELTESPLL